MVANPKQTPQIGQRARATIPMAPELLRRDDAPPVSEESRLEIVDDCKRCDGTGHMKQRQTACNVCGLLWWEHEVHNAQRGFRLVRRVLLPCGHAPETRDLVYRHPKCPTCGGDGELRRPITLGDLLDFFVSLYPESISQEITAHLRAARTF